MPVATIAARREAGGGLLLVALDVAPEVASAYVAPGQYVEVKVPKGNGYFVLAGDVATTPFELLVRNAGDAADALHNEPLGTAVEVTMPLGKGFPTERARGRDLVVGVAGSALAVARPLLRKRIAEGAAAHTWVFMGMRRTIDLPLAGEVAGWVRAGAHVVVCLSAEGDADVPSAWTVDRGYVQHVLARAFDTPESDVRHIPRGAFVVAAGPSAMLADMRSLGAAHGVEVVTNV